MTKRRVVLRVQRHEVAMNNPRQERVPRSLLALIDLYFTKILGLSALAHLFLVLALLVTPYDPRGLDDDLFKNANRFVQLLRMPQPRQRVAFTPAAGGRHRGKEGKRGMAEAKKPDTAPGRRGGLQVDPSKREHNRRVAMNTGFLKVLRGSDNAVVASVLGEGGLGHGVNHALSGLRGTVPGEAHGAGGMGTRGNDPGGGGHSLGIGEFGAGDGIGPGGPGGPSLVARDRGRLGVQGPTKVVSKGCLLQDVVGRVLARAHSQARYCYERELGRDPNLAGKITTHFVIGPTGAVTSVRIRASTLNDAAVESCLATVIARLVFPPCAGGGTAEVTYPWMFTSTGK
ncbi:MAG: AgmX/PglI C-terminal domain-containing protein [Deltaproteobacteria bacterium]|nr:AgmX/PglI C-terminal domain-containing protein [Deltaproteobacteria bacterium]